MSQIMKSAAEVLAMPEPRRIVGTAEITCPGCGQEWLDPQPGTCTQYKAGQWPSSGPAEGGIGDCPACGLEIEWYRPVATAPWATREVFGLEVVFEEIEGDVTN